jgi:hypothetical protein
MFKQFFDVCHAVTSSVSSCAVIVLSSRPRNVARPRAVWLFTVVMKRKMVIEPQPIQHPRLV